MDKAFHEDWQAMYVKYMTFVLLRLSSFFFLVKPHKVILKSNIFLSNLFNVYHWRKITIKASTFEVKYKNNQIIIFYRCMYVCCW